jgi:dCMP deaminase
MYLNGFPCKICARLIVNSGIKKIVMRGDYSDQEGLKILKEGKVEIVRFDPGEMVS